MILFADKFRKKPAVKYFLISLIAFGCSLELL